MKKYCKYLFDKEHTSLTIDEKFFITYFIFSVDIKQAIFEFQYETKFRIFSKMSLQELNNYENRLNNIYKTKKQKVTNLFNQYKETNYGKESIKKINKHTIGTPMSTHGSHGFIHNDHFSNFVKKNKKENDKFTQIIDENKLEYIVKLNESKK